MNSDGTDNIKNKTSDTSAVPPIITEKTAVSTDNRDIDLNTSKASEEQTISEKENQTEPIADENLKPTVTKKRENVILRNVIQISCGVIIGAGAGYFLLYLLIPVLLTPTEFLLILVFIIISLFINLNLYKLGQLIAGRICGGQLIAYQCTCLRFYRNEGTMRRRLTPSHSFEGVCSIIPPSNSNYPVSTYIAFYTGGFAACFAVGCFCVVTAIFLSVNASGGLLFSGTVLNLGKTAYFIMFLWINSIFSLIYTALSLLPVFWNDSPSDGLILYALLKKNPYTSQLIILRTVTIQLAAGIRPSDIYIPKITPVRIIKEKTGHTAGFLDAVKQTLNRLFLLISKLKSYLIGKILNTVFIKPNPNKSDSVEPVDSVKSDDSVDSVKSVDSVEPVDSVKPVDSVEPVNSVKSDESDDSVKNQAMKNITDAVTAAEILDIPQITKPINLFDDKPLSDKISIIIGVLFYKIKLRICPRKINKDNFQIELFPEPDVSNNTSACTLLLKLYYYYIALDNAEHADMRAHLLMIEENIAHIPRQMLQRVCRELCFYYSISRNSKSAIYYMGMMERSSDQKKSLDDLRVRAYFEMYINRRYKTAFSMCRNAMETAVADSSGGLTVMNRELVKGLVTLIHQKSSLSKSE